MASTLSEPVDGVASGRRSKPVHLGTQRAVARMRAHEPAERVDEQADRAGSSRHRPRRREDHSVVRFARAASSCTSGMKSAVFSLSSARRSRMQNARSWSSGSPRRPPCVSAAIASWPWRVTDATRIPLAHQRAAGVVLAFAVCFLVLDILATCMAAVHRRDRHLVR